MGRSWQLWEEAEIALAWRKPQKDASPLARIERLSKEHFPSIAEPINPQTCTISEIMLDPGAIRSLKCWHCEASPQRNGGKLVLFRHDETYGIVDGNNRVNLWLSGSQVESMLAIVIELCV